jgi:hypothetical protein
MLNRVYAVLGTVILSAYGWVAYSGWEFGHPDRGTIPADVRQAPGGYRSFHFWHVGYMGGK